jgi:membrane protein required for colicin V production
MNSLDAILLVGLTPFAVRGLFRGLCREAFGVAGLVGAVFAGAAGASRLGAILAARELVSPPWAEPAAFALLFLGAVVAANLVGRVADRLARALLLGWLNRVAGLAFGALKGATVLGFGLLAAERLVASPAFTERLGASRLGRPLERWATTVFEAGRALATASHA